MGTLDVHAASANTGNIVQIVGATKGKTKTPASVINGSGNAKPTSVFEIYSPTQMYNVVVTGGSGNTGGGIYTQSALDLENAVVRNNTSCSSFTNNVCTTFADGGGIYLGGPNTTTPHLSLYRTTVTKNTAHFGGGLANENNHHTSIAIFSSHIDKNIACDTFSNGVCVGSGSGGGIYDDGESLLLENSTVKGNQAGSPAYDTGTFNTQSKGGGLYTNDTAQLIHTLVSGNVAGQYGGGVYADDHVDFVNSKVSNNVADYQGGGVFIDYLLTSKNSTFSGNVAGGTFECTINGNSTTCKHTAKTMTGSCFGLYPSATACINYDGYGGGLYSYEEYPQVIATTISNNVAASISGDAADCVGGKGGGVYSYWTFTMVGGSKVTGNSADCGGGVYNYSGGPTSVYTFDFADSSITKNSAIEDGGAIWTAGSGSGTLYGMTITGNTAGRHTGGVWDDQLGSVLLGVGNKLVKNTSPGACKNITQPCK